MQPHGALCRTQAWLPTLPGYFWLHLYVRTGFSESVRDERLTMPDHFRPLLGECQVLFGLLRHYAIEPMPLQAYSVQRPIAASGDHASGASQQAASAAAGGDGGKKEKMGTHVYLQDLRNADILIGIRNGVTGTFDTVGGKH